MRGTILKRARGSWTIIVDVGKDSGGRRNQRWATVKGNKKAAERRLAEILDKVNKGLYITPIQDTLGDFMGTWLVDQGKAYNARWLPRSGGSLSNITWRNWSSLQGRNIRR